MCIFLSYVLFCCIQNTIQFNLKRAQKRKKAKTKLCLNLMIIKFVVYSNESVVREQNHKQLAMISINWEKKDRRKNKTKKINHK